MIDPEYSNRGKIVGYGNKHLEVKTDPKNPYNWIIHIPGIGIHGKFLCSKSSEYAVIEREIKEIINNELKKIEQIKKSI